MHRKGSPEEKNIFFTSDCAKSNKTAISDVTKITLTGLVDVVRERGVIVKSFSFQINNPRLLTTFGEVYSQWIRRGIGLAGFLRW